MAMGGSPVCPPTTQICGYFTDQGQIEPDWDADASTYRIRQEFEPVVDLTNSSIIGHEDEEPLHPGIMYTAQVVLSDRNGWDDIEFVQFALGQDVNDDETSIFIQLEEDENGLPKAKLESGGEYIAVSNLYSQVSTFGDDENQLLIRARFNSLGRSTEAYDTNGLDHFIPILKVTDKACNEGESIHVIPRPVVLVPMHGVLTTISDSTPNQDTLRRLNCVMVQTITMTRLKKL